MIALFFMFLLHLTPKDQLTIFHVSLHGSDDADGLTEATAFRTLEQAQTAMRGTGGNDETRVHEGTYHLTTPLYLRAEDNGSKFVAAAGEDVTLSGGRAMRGWVQGADGIWTARINVADVHQMTLNGVNQTEARFPNAVPGNPIQGGWLFAEDLPDGVDKQRHMAFDPDDVSAAQLKPGAEVHVFAGVSWANNTLTVQSVDRVHNIVTFTSAADYDLTAASRYFVQGDKILLDKPGEWFFDTATRTMHFKAPPGFDGTGAIAAGDDSVFDIDGASNITISGFTISDAATDATSSNIYSAGVTLRDSQNIIITDNTFINLAKGVRAAEDSHDVTVRNNDFQHIWGAAIELAQGTSDNSVVGNAIRWVGEVYVAESAIQLNETAGNLIRGNLIRDVPRMGIGELHYDPAIASGGNIIELNTIIHAMQQTSDGGAIYIYSSTDNATRGDTIRFNRIIDAGGLETEPGGFRPGREYSNGIYLDDFTSGVTVTGNFVQGAVRGGIYLHGGSDNTVWNNITLDNADIGIQLYAIGGRPMLRNDLYNNIVGMTGAGGQVVELEPAFVAPWSMHDNWFLRPATQFTYQTFAQWQALGYEAGSDVIAPGIFRNPLTGDFRLATGSLPLLQGFTDLPWAQMQAFRGGVIRAGTESGDRLTGSTGADLMIGLGGRDWFDGGAGADDFEGGAGIDTISYAASPTGVRARLSGLGWQGDRAIGIENLIGSAFNDVLFGNAAANRLYGGHGNDRLIGGAGADVFVFGPRTGSDRVVDFQHGIDRIDLRSMDGLAWRDTAAFTGNAAEVRLTQRLDGRHLLIDLNADALADVDITLLGTGTFTRVDLVL